MKSVSPADIHTERNLFIFRQRKRGADIFMTIAERIAALPAAVNLAQPGRSYLAQGKQNGRTSKAEQSEDITNASRLQKSLYAVEDSDYSKADAVNKQWRKMNTVNILDILDGTADTSNRTLTSQEIEQRLQQGDLLNDISNTDFGMLKFELSGIEFEMGVPASADTFHKNVEYLASRYAAMEDRIKNTCKGTEQKEYLEQLNDIYKSTLERAANEYSNLVGGILGKYGVLDEREKIYRAFKNGVDERAAEYRTYLKENPGFTGLEGTKDSWLLKDDEYIASRLRSQNIASTRDAKDDEYTLQDLEVIGKYASSLSAMEKKSNTYDLNEERMGLELAMLAMKTDILGAKAGVSPMLNTTLKNTLEGYIRAFLEQFDNRLDTNRKKAYTASDIQGNAHLDKDSVWRVYNMTMESYRISGDVVQAMLKGAEYGKAQYSEKMNQNGTKNIYRYKNGNTYWNQFFQASTVTKANGYEKNVSTFEQHMMGWVDFNMSLEEKQGIRMNLCMDLAEYDSVDYRGNQFSREA